LTPIGVCRRDVSLTERSDWVGVVLWDMLEGAGKVEAEIVGGAENAVRGCARLDGQDTAENIRLCGTGNHVREDTQDVGLLAEGFQFSRICHELAGIGPALLHEATADVEGPDAVIGNEVAIAQGLLKVGSLIERGEVLEGRDAGFAVRIVSRVPNQ